MKKGLSSFLQTKTNLAAMRCLPRPFILAYLSLLSKYYFYRYPDQKLPIEHSIRAAFPSLGEDEQRSLVKTALLGLVKHYAEKIHNVAAPDRRLAAFFRSRVNGAENLRRFLECRQAGSGLLLLTGHYGGVEYLPKLFALQNLPTSIIARFPSRRLADSFYAQAKALNINVINEETYPDRIARAHQIFKDLGEGRILIMLIDEFSYWKSGKAAVNFLNRRVPFFSGLDTLAERCRRRNIPVFFGVLERLENDAYEFSATRLAPDSARQESSAAKAIGLLTEKIKNNPHNWYAWRDLPPLPVVRP